MKVIKNILLQFACYQSPGIIYSYSVDDEPDQQYMEILLMPDERLEKDTLNLIKTIVECEGITNLSILFMSYDLEKEDKLQQFIDCIEPIKIVDTLYLKQMEAIRLPILLLSELIYQPTDLVLCSNSSILKIKFENSYKALTFDQFKVEDTLLQKIKANDLSFVVASKTSLKAILMNQSIKSLSFYIDLNEYFSINIHNQSIYDLNIYSKNQLYQYHHLLMNFTQLDYFNFTRLYDE